MILRPHNVSLLATHLFIFLPGYGNDSDPDNRDGGKRQIIESVKRISILTENIFERPGFLLIGFEKLGDSGPDYTLRSIGCPPLLECIHFHIVHISRFASGEFTLFLINHNLYIIFEFSSGILLQQSVVFSKKMGI
jgi:hypothetical protein